MPLLQSVSLPMFDSAIPDPRQLVEIVAKGGFRGIEIWGRTEGFQTWLSLAKEYRLTLCSMVAHRAALNRTECHAEAEGEIKKSIDIAAANGIPKLICFSGNRFEDQSDQTASDVVAEGFRRVVSYAGEKKITLVMELLNSKVDHPGYLADHTAWGVEVCRKVGSPHLRLLYDIYHMQIMEGDIIRTIRDNIEWIAHFHTAGNPGRNEIGRGQELNYAAIGAAIRETGFSGFIGHEFQPLGDVTASLREAFMIIQGEEP